MFSDLALSRRLERAEGRACVEFAEAQRRLYPDSGAEWIECAGAYAAFNGVDSPVTQTFGLGIFEELTRATLDTVERFLLDRSAPVLHEVSPFAGGAALDLLCSRNYTRDRSSPLQARRSVPRLALPFRCSSSSAIS